MHPNLRLAWHFGGLICVITGAAMIAGLAGALIAVGAWAMVGTMFDLIAERLP